MNRRQFIRIAIARNFEKFKDIPAAIFIGLWVCIQALAITLVYPLILLAVIIRAFFKYKA